MDSTATAGLFSSDARLYSLEGEGALASLQVEGWIGREALSGVAQMRIVALADSAGLSLNDMIARPLTLWTTRADGSRASRSGLVREAELLSGDAGLARYRLTVAPWLWLATQRRTSRIFEAKPVQDIVRHVLDAYEGYAYRIAPDVEPALADLAPRPYVTQYRETDYEFLSRLLAEAGLGWTVVEDADAPARHALLIFTDSRGLQEDEESAGGGVRFHRADATESRDTVQALARQRRRVPDRITVLGWHDSGKRAVAAEALVNPASGEDDAAGLEWYEPVGHGGFADEAQARRQATLAMEAVRARAETFIGRGGVRTFRSGTRFTLQAMSSLGPAGEDGFEPVFALDRIEHVGINNLPPETRASLAQRLGGLDAHLLLDEDAPPPPGGEPQAGATASSADAAVLAKAREVGYANRFEAVRCDRPWRPELPQERGARLSGAPSVHGVHSAVVTDAEGGAQAKEQDEILRNKRGDVRIKFHWQGDAKDGEAKSRWVRVAQRQSGAGMGISFVPRIGQEVLVRFLDDDVDQPIVVGALYNGRGEGGTPATPGGRQGSQADTQVYAAARDATPSAQANLASGNAPAWHGAGAGDANHRNAAALSGFKSKEFGGSGYNQIVFDDTDGQLRVQIKSSQEASELNLGHLIHQAGNYRGGLRGLGAELRSDGYGAVRGGAGVLLSTYVSTGGPASGAGDAAGLQALAGQTDQMARSLDSVAGAHEGLRLATALGTRGPEASALDGGKAPLAAMHRAVSGTVAGDSLESARGDASAKHTQAAEGKVPHPTDPVVLMAARAGLAQIAGQHMQYTAGEAVHWSSGKDQNLAVMGALRLHTGQGLGIVAGLQQGGADSGLDLISAKGNVDVQAQHDILRVQAQKDIRIGSAQTSVECAAPKRIRIATAAGASIVLEGGNITVTAPGRIDVKTGNKQFSGPDRMPYAFPQYTVCKQCVLDAHDGVQSITDKA
ncbi:type IV secretion protein Rhs [Achromobacter sp. RTa]|uniref:type VI secretion system Vgr family protein n=1 Tax=Achromobacter sp. RTa TaxID=1532557 RepID=UPI00050E232C|nr:type VI secretion system Vgr family protein [Achromobacter sp. RTa]KGD90380.1 type IV secretion protein Rhs [Achromobacter sp. RTa]